MNILVSNDDGIDSNGIYCLVTELRKYYNVEVVEPDNQHSAVGHAITISNTLRCSNFNKNGSHFGYSVNGTPSDCVKLALSKIIGFKPDFILSGINHGRNTANSIMYSGTVSAATEGTMLRIPSMAISLDSVLENADFEYAAKIASKLVSHFIDNPFPIKTLLNVNVPAISELDIKGFKITTQGDSYWNDTYEKRIDPLGREYYWLTGNYILEGDENSDDIALRDGYISITPIHTRITNYSSLDYLKDSIKDLK